LLTDAFHVDQAGEQQRANGLSPWALMRALKKVHVGIELPSNSKHRSARSQHPTDQQSVLASGMSRQRDRPDFVPAGHDTPSTLAAVDGMIL